MSRRNHALLVTLAALTVQVSACALEDGAPAGPRPDDDRDLPEMAALPEDGAMIRGPGAASMDPMASPSVALGVCPVPGANDSDGDGLADLEEVHTDACVADTDQDGVDDLLETIWSDVRCGTSPRDCNCALDDHCRPASDFLAVALPQGESATVALDVDSTVDRADVFFLVDDSASMMAPYTLVRDALVSGRLIGQIEHALPDLEVGVGWEEGFGFAPGAAGDDAPFVLGAPVSTGWEHDLAAAFSERSSRVVGDPIDAHMVALAQVITGTGGMFTSDDGHHQLVPAYADRCAAGRSGGACFRNDAVPVIVHVTDTFTAGSEAPTTSPAAPSASELVPALLAQGARYVGVNASGISCAIDDGPCTGLKQLAAMAPGNTVLDLSDDLDVAAADIARAVTQTVTMTPVAVETHASADDDGRAPFVANVGVSCAGSTALCDVAPAAASDSAAVRTMPGTHVSVQIGLRNDEVASAARSQRFAVRLDSTVGRTSAETRYLYVVVPAAR